MIPNILHSASAMYVNAKDTKKKNEYISAGISEIIKVIRDDIKSEFASSDEASVPEAYIVETEEATSL